MNQIVTFAQDWILNHVTPPLEVSGSLAAEMRKRAIAEDEVRSFDILLRGRTYMSFIS